MSSTSGQASLTHEDYLVGWICPLEVEQVAATLMLDEKHTRLPQPQTDHNVYRLGSIHGHNIVIAGLPIPSNSAAAVVATQMRTTFPRMKFGLLVGIGGGVPVSTDEGPIRLGHVVVSKPDADNSGAVQYDHGKAKAGHFERTGSLAPPPALLLNAAQSMAVDLTITSPEQDPLVKNLRRIDTNVRKLRKFKFPGREHDRLFEVEYLHKTPKLLCDKSGSDLQRTVTRPLDHEGEICPEVTEEIVVHRGTIASGELVLKNGYLRDKLAGKDGLLCFETEAAGALADFPCLVIRGISDYCDEHKNDNWQGYAAATAAAYARNLFDYLPVEDVKNLQISKEDVEFIKRGISHLDDSQLWTQLGKWLCAPDPSSNLNEALDLRQQGTCSWIMDSASFREWKTKPGSFLWLIGRAGTGKTILSSSIIKTVNTIQDSDRLLIYFYFDFRNAAKQSFSGLVRSLLYQLASKSNKILMELHDLFEKYKKGAEQPSNEDIRDLLTKDLATFKCVWIVVDALDECEAGGLDRKALLAWLVHTINQRIESLHVLVTSRDEEDIRESLQPITLSGETIDLQEDHTKQDIQFILRRGFMIALTFSGGKVCRMS